MNKFIAYPYSILEAFFFLWKGMYRTLHSFIHPKLHLTQEYPNNRETLYIPERFKAELTLLKDDQGKIKCTACGLCAVACPAEAITMTAAERTKEEKHLYREEKYASVYEINMLRCIFCGLCEDACPKSAIYLTDRLVDVETNRGSFVYGKDKLVEDMNNRIDISDRQKKS